MAEEIKKLVEEYRDGKLSRREFIQKAIVLTGSLAAATNLIACAVGANGESAQTQPDAALVSTNVQFKGPAGTIYAYQTKPKAPGKYPAVIVVHENRGINDHMRDVAHRIAKEGYVALVPDYLSRGGGTAKVNPKNESLSNVRELAPTSATAEDTGAAVAYLKTLSDVRGDRIGIVGFCWGGETAFNAATQVRGLRAVVVYYGRTPNPADQVGKIEAPVLAHYGSEDKGITGGVPATEAAMKKYNKPYSYTIYPGAGHAFNNDTDPSRYNAAAAKEAWAKTVDFFKKNLQS
jgi:carboxymethylenebutenolidase